MTRQYLSKSKVMAGRQCEKRLWLEVRRHDLIEHGPDVEQRFAVGHDVNNVARAQYPGGALISYDHGAEAAVEDTKRLLEEQPGTPIFEATFKAQDVLVRVDILKPCREGFELIEVKASTSVKDHHYEDCAVQTWVLECAGIPVNAIYLCHIDNQFVYPGNDDYRGLFHYKNITKEVQDLSLTVPQWVQRYRERLNGGKPIIEMGSQCTAPYSCPFIDYCRGKETEYPLRCMPCPRGTRQVIDSLADEGIEDIRDIPEGRLSNNKQKWVRRVTIAGEPELKPEAAEVGAYDYPRYYLDFETIQFAVPIWAGTRPYEALPFQWSCHIELANGELRHEEYVDTVGNSPMRICAESLLRVVGKEGPVFTYAPYEKRILNALATRYPDLAEDLHKLIERLVDLLPIVQRTYYHPDMLGSWSIKNVLPTVAPHLDYGSLGEVQDGNAAGTAYLRIINPETDKAECQRLVRELLAYCKLDTLAMVELVKYLSSGAKPTYKDV
ncbi:MAG: DUF2779 domain-containing protein [Gemmatimonadetes bacterium]|nr:DUF2779 domain-containing protein [Gemmatimonadota bacterium]MXY83032.1 DUF2779 domain-containing protein [Gemmatimonadota bacterium]MYB69689.1 DUF2779 domain-containing protein [Gemmatimonadota bacterium]